VGISMPPTQFTVTGSPVTTSGSFTVSLNNPTGTGAIVLANAPTFLGLVTIPQLSVGNAGAEVSGELNVTRQVVFGSLAGSVGIVANDSGGILSSVLTTGTGNVVLAGSPALTGIPTAPTAALGTNTTQVATMAALQAANTGSNDFTWSIPSGTSMPATNTYLGNIWYLKANTTTGIGIINVETPPTCGTTPTYSIVDLGPVITTSFGSSTTVASSSFTGNGIGGFLAGSLSLTGGHYFGFGFTAGVCSVFPRVDVTLVAF
jgi:hypothetical protein